ncbi:hypothetical protein [Reichenbachiella sp.]|uniref:hypothetical protein n=1 Tax=Reichenbachiella sp. TaxID=2184521 RepID=UPI003BAED9FA
MKYLLFSFFAFSYSTSAIGQVDFSEKTEFAFSGVEPFWKAEFQNGKIIVSNGGMIENLKFDINEPKPFVGRDISLGRTYVSTSGEHELILIFNMNKECSCSLDMAQDKEFAFYSTMILDGQTYTGCGDIRKK